LTTWWRFACRRQFTFSKIVGWVAMDRTVREAERFNFQPPLEPCRKVHDRMRATICGLGLDSESNAFTQSFGGRELDASLPLIPLVGFLRADDPQVRGTVASIEQLPMIGGLALRYRAKTDVDVLAPGEGVFVSRSPWLANNYKLQDQDAKACALFKRLFSPSNDVGPVAEDYYPTAQRQLGSFPRAFSHRTLIGLALSLNDTGPAQQRGQRGKVASQCLDAEAQC